MDKKLIFLILIGLIIFSIRLVNLNEFLIDDESNFADSVANANKFGFNPKYYSALFFNWIEILLISIFGVSIWVFRVVPWIFGIINTVLVYYFAKRNYDEKTGMYAVLLMLFSFYPTLASLQFDVEGNFVMFSILLMFFSYLEYEKSGKGYWLLIGGLGLGTAVVNKYNSVFVIFPLMAYSLFKSKFNISESIKKLFWLYFTGLCVFGFYVIWAMISSPDWWNYVSIIGIGRYTSNFYSLIGVAIYVVWSTALLFGFYLLSLYNWDKKNLMLVLWISSAILWYTFILKAGSHDRYFMNTIPALCILGGYYIGQIRWKKIDIYLLVLGLATFWIILLTLNSGPIKYLARSPSLYLQELLSGNPNFLFVYTSASGPTFGVNFLALCFAFALGFGFLGLYFIIFALSKKNFSKYFLIGFLAVGLAYNLFIIGEYLFDIQGPDVSSVQHEMINYFNDNNLKYPVYPNDQGMQFFLDQTYWNNFTKSRSFADQELDGDPSRTIAMIRNRGGTVLLLKWPPLPIGSDAYRIIAECSLEKEFDSKGISIGEIHVC